MTVALRQPAMAEHIQMKAGSAVQVSFKSESFFLLVPDADEPLQGDGTRPQANGDAGIVKPVCGETEAGLKLGYSICPLLEQATSTQCRAVAPLRRL